MNQKPSLTNLEKAVHAYDEAIGIYQNRLAENASENEIRVLKMAIIQAYEFSVDQSWKHIQKVLFYLGDLSTDFDGLKSNFFNIAFENGLINDPKKWLEYYRNRNISSHNYGEDVLEIGFRYAMDFNHEAKALIVQLKKALND
jgi:nucleotidyltransferase substrate binding protein (TIGR01987 family)